MESTRNIKRQVQSVKNIAKITKAMEMVSAAKMKRSQEAALASRPYAEAALRLLQNIGPQLQELQKNYPLAERRVVKKIALLVITSDKGLCGGLNSNVIRLAQKFLAENDGKTIEIIAVGKKSEKAFRGKNNITAYFDLSGKTLTLKETFPVSHLLMEDFKKRQYDEVWAVYTNFISTLKQEPDMKKILPVTETTLKQTIEEMGEDEKGRANKLHTEVTEYIFEPSAEQLLNSLLPGIVETQVFHVLLESGASEHSARMVAMKNATESAEEVLEDLNLSYNYARQQKITQEMTEISAGVTAQTQ